MKKPETKTPEQEILGLANENGKFAIELDYVGSAEWQLAFERLQLSGRIRLIDLSPVADFPGKLFRVFMVVRKTKVKP